MPQIRPHTDSLRAAGSPTQSGPGQGSPDEDSLAADSLTTDSLAAPCTRIENLSSALPFPVYGTPDSLIVRPWDNRVVYRDVTAVQVFGPASTIAEVGPLPAAQAQSLTQNPVFQGFVLLLAATYAMLLYHNLGDVRQLLKRISRDAGSPERISEDPGGSGFLRFLNTVTVIGMLFMGVVVVKYGDSMMPRTLLEMLSHGAVLAMSLLVTLACTAVILYQWVALRIAGAVTLSQPLISQLLLYKRTYFSLAVVIASPALLLFALCPRTTGNVWFYTVVALLTVTAVLYLRETLNLFISKKISILHWFLYLCTVEIFPISFICLIAVR